jgi:predicted permease
LGAQVISFVWRSTCYPLVYLGLGLLFALPAMDLRILVLYGLVPPALYASLIAVFFDLDTDLANSVFTVGTLLFLFGVLPVYALLALP